MRKKTIKNEVGNLNYYFLINKVGNLNYNSVFSLSICFNS